MRQAHFIIPGEPKGKGRPRFSTGRTKGGKPFTTVRSPDDTIVYENLVRLEYERQCRGIYFEKDVPVAVEVRAYYQIPKSVSKKRTKMMLSGEIRPLKRPDSDNVLKSILDAMNGFAFYDDAQVTDISASKFYGDVPRVEVTVKEVVYGKLLPCPFCGGEAYYTGINSRPEGAFRIVGVECRRCGAHPYAVTLSISLSEDEQREAAAGHWNRRAKTEHQKEETNAQ